MKRIIGALLWGSDARPARAFGVVSLAAGWFAVLATAAARIAGARLSTGDVALLVCLAAALMASGATMLILDALQNGFGALDAFFQEALARSARRASEEARPAPQQHAAARVQRRGYIGDRPYVLYGDGAVAVETLLGVRRFASLHEAEEFIGA